MLIGHKCETCGGEWADGIPPGVPVPTTSFCPYCEYQRRLINWIETGDPNRGVTG